MASNTTLEFDVLAKDRASSVLSKIGQGFQKFGTISRIVGAKSAGAMGRLGGAIAGAAKMGVAGVAVLGAGLVAAAPKVFEMAGNLELMGKKAQVVFGSQLGSVQRWAATNAHAMGVTKREAVGLAAGFADLLIPMGFQRKAAADMATKTIGLAGALAEWTGGQKSAAEVAEVLSAAYMGERDGLNALGISITQAEVDAALLAKGQDKLTGKARQQAEALATQKLIMEKSTDAQRAFAAGGDSLARKVTVTKARLKEMGQTLLVAATPALTKIASIVQSHVLPQLERFANWLAGDGKFIVAQAFIAMAQHALTFARVTSSVLLAWASTLIKVFAKALGWHPQWGAKLRAAAANIDQFRAATERNLDKAIGEVNQWNRSIQTMRTEAKLKANITDLDNKLAAARRGLADPKLSATKKAQLRADIADLLAKKRQAQQAIDALKGKTVVIRYTATGVNLTTPSSVGRRQLGGPVRAGVPVIVGETRPELFVPATDGRILPRVPTAAAGGGGTVVNIHVNGALDPIRVAQQIQQLLKRLKKTNGGMELGLA